MQHFVYSSVGSAHRRTSIPHFENKWRIEEKVRELGFPSHVVLRPVFFMENVLTLNMLSGDTLSAALDPRTRLQMIAVTDIGRYGARAFTDAAALNGRAIDIAGDALTMPEAAETLSQVLGRPITFVSTPISQVREYSEDAALMMEWFDRVGFNADVRGLEREFGFRQTTFAEWARTNVR